jgi:hypothetical protein
MYFSRMKMKPKQPAETVKRKQVSVAGIPEYLITEFQVAAIRCRVPFNQWALAAWTMFRDSGNISRDRADYLAIAGKELERK